MAAFLQLIGFHPRIDITRKQPGNFYFWKDSYPWWTLEQTNADFTTSSFTKKNIRFDFDDELKIGEA